ncbi:hypothetical protein C7M61_001930 [Candidozyma pseudohaemuli]|uniref:Uncharacterized protein n=1 Tax=Candidozyma pseudohaemuli TaxID=418784 RepID=A0A2P7YTP2_9ASCO|nr:hypothetical protein C7M61_001930 [[Candida] pseudohaemulonii]PSK39321.1 hypothetical protein C7M61_001930 [[Candida] pseudohaemulonii]
MGGATLVSKPASTPAYDIMISPYHLLFLSVSIFFFLAIMAEQHEELIVDLNGKQVPLLKISKPHHRILDHNQKPVPDPKTFPDVEPEAKEREAKLAEERKQAAEQKELNE